MGDLHSKRYGETFRLYRDFNKYQNSKGSKEANEILLEEDRQKLVEVFDAKTQGFDYHIYILAIAMLIESRFPNSALVSGDIDYAQCIKAKEWADKYLDLPIKLPVRVQWDKLLLRIPNRNNELEQIHFLEKWLISDSEELLKIIYTNFSRKTFLHWFSYKLQSFSSPKQLGALKLLIYYLNVICDVNNLLLMVCIDENGPKFSPFEIMKALARTWIFLPREKFSYLKLFDKIAGNPQIIERQFGEIILDMKFAGREIKSYIPLQEVMKSLVYYFPELESQIETTLLKEMSRIEEELLMFFNQIRSTIELPNVSTIDRKYLADEDAFLYFDNDSVILSEEQDLLLKGIAYSIKIFFTKKEMEF
ncbi:hypothetical protein ACQKP0_14880 [Heyndrickxia sp. NPDC080065]|uniref:hypothetical protein n=1 Tax=Heyndrickxia sp. NPDC080065 TaxID=3390568 RepID=UPI003CFC931A